jgi:type II secretory pathway predicted ATPase ExeA
MPDAIFSSFGLRENPFKINPDPRFIFLTERADATLKELIYGISTRKGLMLLAGEVGTGKTMLLRRLLDWLGEQKMPTALIFNSRITSDHLLDFILNDFGIPCESGSKSDKLLSLNRWLLERYRAGQTPVLIVDEAQGLSPQALEEIRLLLNCETPREKLLQVVLAGQPELEEKLKQHELRQLRQRITIRCRTAPLTPEQTHGYIRERLRIAGAGSEPIFEPEAVTAVHAYSHGIPRVINVLCDHSLINSCADGCKTVSPRAVEQAARQCQLDRTESVARILNSGSYARADLADVGSILAAISGASSVPVTAGPVFRSASPAQPRLAASPAPERVASVNIPAEPSISQAYASTTATSSQSSELTKPRSFANRDGQPSRAALVSRKDVVTRRNFSFAPSLSVARRVWRSWHESFFLEAKTVWRQTRRLLRSMEMRYWKPLARDISDGTRHLQSSAARLAADPRWEQLQNRLKRWLHAPLGNGQKRTMNSGQRRTTGR